jgi:hypothetical protein
LWTPCSRARRPSQLPVAITAASASTVDPSLNRTATSLPRWATPVASLSLTICPPLVVTADPMARTNAGGM